MLSLPGKRTYSRAADVCTPLHALSSNTHSFWWLCCVVSGTIAKRVHRMMMMTQPQPKQITALGRQWLGKSGRTRKELQREL